VLGYFKYALNEVHRQLGDYAGYRVSATFSNGVVRIEKAEIDPNEPLREGDCSFPYDQYLAARSQASVGNCKPEDYIGSVARGYFYFTDAHPSFPNNNLGTFAPLVARRINSPITRNFYGKFAIGKLLRSAKVGAASALRLKSRRSPCTTIVPSALSLVMITSFIQQSAPPTATMLRRI
jgi:hypothetical protein